MCVCADLYGFEHALSVVVRPQVFGDVEAHRANGGDEMKNHRNNLNDKQTVLIGQTFFGCLWHEELNTMAIYDQNRSEKLEGQSKHI